MSTFQQFNLYPGLTPVRVASTSNVAGTYFNGATNNGVGATLTVAASSLTVDSVVLVVGDRLLLQTQTNTNEQGIYVVNSIGATVVLQRSADMQSIEQIKAGQYVSVAAGSVEAGNFFSVVEPLPAHLGVDALVFNADPSAGGVTFSGGASTANALAVFSNTAGDLKAATTTTTLGQSLSVTGTVTGSTGLVAATGGVTATAGNFLANSGYYINSVIGSLTALAGGAQAGTALTREINRITTVVTAADSVQLPAAILGLQVVVINAAAANACAVFPQTGESINALAANSSISLAANKVMMFFCGAAGVWNSLLTA